MIDLATITVNAVNQSKRISVFVKDILRVEQAGAEALIRFRDGTSLLVEETDTAVQAAIDALWDQYTARGTVADRLEITDGVTAPGAGSGVARIYVDTADGDLKCVYADGTVKVIVADT